LPFAFVQKATERVYAATPVALLVWFVSFVSRRDSTPELKFSHRTAYKIARSLPPPTIPRNPCRKIVASSSWLRMQKSHARKVKNVMFRHEQIIPNNREAFRTLKLFRGRQNRLHFAHFAFAFRTKFFSGRAHSLDFSNAETSVEKMMPPPIQYDAIENPNCAQAAAIRNAQPTAIAAVYLFFMV